MSSVHPQEQDYYAIIGVARDAPAAVIRASYRRLMRKAGNHPNLGGDTQIAARINRAYAVLKDPEQRQFYDARLDILSRIAAGIESEPATTILDPRSNCLFCEQPHNYILEDTDEVCCDSCGSPLREVDHTRLNSDDTRAVQRLGRGLDIQLYTHSGQSMGIAARTTDISPQGLKLTSTCELRPGQRIRIVGEVLEAVGRVTHQSQSRQGWQNVTVAAATCFSRVIVVSIAIHCSTPDTKLNDDQRLDNSRGSVCRSNEPRR